MVTSTSHLLSWSHTCTTISSPTIHSSSKSEHQLQSCSSSDESWAAGPVIASGVATKESSWSVLVAASGVAGTSGICSIVASSYFRWCDIISSIDLVHSLFDPHLCFLSPYVTLLLLSLITLLSISYSLSSIFSSFSFSNAAFISAFSFSRFAACVSSSKVIARSSSCNNWYYFSFSCMAFKSSVAFENNSRCFLSTSASSPAIHSIELISVKRLAIFWSTRWTSQIWY